MGSCSPPFMAEIARALGERHEPLKPDLQTRRTRGSAHLPRPFHRPHQDHQKPSPVRVPAPARHGRPVHQPRGCRRAERPDLGASTRDRRGTANRAKRRILAHWAGPAPVTECDPISGPACCLPAMRAAGGVDPWLPQPVLAILVRVLDQRQGRHLLVLEQVRRLDLNGFGLAPCGKDHRFVMEHLLIDVEGCA